ncbi:hypothetical protein TorRG33x02_240800 [Trema orientale]|uniref:Uncharacterized protein n=1 Tax=Trema orientale TaxID=63057 RepID=A0A2P5DUZ3_TREOI|nr:hypothetical protein TorRG33x02_240800 [Trema orientale]
MQLERSWLFWDYLGITDRQKLLMSKNALIERFSLSSTLERWRESQIENIGASSNLNRTERENRNAMK